MSSHTIEKKGPTCQYCWNNPVNHTFAWLSQTLSICMLPVARLGAVVQTEFLNTIFRWGMTPYMYFFRALGLLHFSTDITKACSERSQVIWEEANRRGIPMEQFVLHNRPIEQYRAYVNGAWHYFMSLPIPPWKNTRAYVWIDDKYLLKKKFLKAGVPTPRGGHAWTFSQAHALFEKLEKPLITKPELGSRGRHTTTQLYTNDDLRHGFKVAQQLCEFVIVEENLVGSVYRGTYVNGEVVGINRGDPPRVTGDGVSTIAMLIQKKNETRPEGVTEYVADEMGQRFLARQGYDLDTVLPAGKRIDLLEKIGMSFGGDSIEEFPRTHPKILAHLKKAGDVLGVPIVGFDFIVDDIAADPDTQKWGIIEANAVPFINLHHFQRVGEPINVAGKVWDMWDERKK